MINILKNILKYFIFKKDPIFSIDPGVQKTYLDSFEIPSDAIESSFYQYKCQTFLQGWFISLLGNLFGFIIILPYFFLFRMNGFCRSGFQTKNADAVLLINDFSENLLPEQIKLNYVKRVKEPLSQMGYLTKKDASFVFKLVKRYPLSPYFYFKIVYKIAVYRCIIDKYNPTAIITSAEYSYTSSVLTFFCEQNNVKQINIMHGEKLFYIREAFNTFHEFYVWDAHYVKLFNQLHASRSKFIIAQPDSLKLKIHALSDIKTDYKFFLVGEKLETLKRIKEVVKILEANGKTVLVRYHPRNVNLKLFHQVFRKEETENPNEISIEKSISESANIISLYSTIMYQAYLSGKNVIIDDVTDKAKFERLKELDYIMLSKEVKYLSDVLTVMPGVLIEK